MAEEDGRVPNARHREHGEAVCRYPGSPHEGTGCGRKRACDDLAVAPAIADALWSGGVAAADSRPEEGACRACLNPALARVPLPAAAGLKEVIEAKAKEGVLLLEQQHSESREASGFAEAPRRERANASDRERERERPSGCVEEERERLLGGPAGAGGPGSRLAAACWRLLGPFRVRDFATSKTCLLQQLYNILYRRECARTCQLRVFGRWSGHAGHHIMPVGTCQPTGGPSEATSLRNRMPSYVNRRVIAGSGLCAAARPRSGQQPVPVGASDPLLLKGVSICLSI